MKASRKDGVLSFVFSGLNNLALMRFNQKCIKYSVTSIVLERQYMFGVKKFAQSRESVVEQKRLGRRAVLTSDDQCSDHGTSFSCIDLIDGINT